jgi:hypothetical protein
MISTLSSGVEHSRPKPEVNPRPTTDSRISVDVRELFRSYAGIGNKVLYRWNSNRPEEMPVATLFTLTNSALITVKHLGGTMPDETLDVIYTPCRYGGRRAWFQCTRLGCGKRVALLYDHHKGFRCRHCCHLDYQSHRERSHDRTLRRARRFRAKAGGGNNLLQDFPPRPKGMHWRTYERLFVAEASQWGEIAQAARKRLRKAGGGRSSAGAQEGTNS